jgi:hypothetical protein
MADFDGTCSPAPLYVYISRNMQALYARRGMWCNDAPQGRLAAMLGSVVPFLSNACRQAFYVTPDQLAALWRDMCSVPPEAIGGHQHGQFLRRLREAALRGGLDIQQLLASEDGTLSPAGPVPAPLARSAMPAPFLPLQRPTQAKAAALFTDHVWRTMRDFVDYSQSSAYLQGDRT